MAKAKLITFAN